MSQPHPTGPVAVQAPAHALTGDDAENFETVFRATRDRLLRELTRVTGSAQLAAELCTHTFQAAWYRLAEVPRGPEAYDWLLDIAHDRLR